MTESEVPEALKIPFKPTSQGNTSFIPGVARRILAVACLSWFSILLIGSGLAQSSGSELSWIPPRVDREFPSLFELYRHLHANPEIAFQEARTAQRMAQELEASGFEVSRSIGGHGVVGLLRNGEGPTLMLRTDLDGLPITEETGLEYASKVRIRDPDGQSIGLMHACGHDVHMTCFVGAARILGREKKRWKGTLMMVAQPAEERGAGAKAMLADGLFQKFPVPDYAIALHNDAGMQAGRVGVCSGYALAGVDSVDLVVRGISGHGGYPSTTKDPVVMAAQTVLSLQTIVSREIPAIDPAVITVGSIHGGTKHSIIPDEVRLQLTVRYYTDETRDRIRDGIGRISEGIARAAGMPPDRLPLMSILDSTPPTYNDPALARRASQAMARVLGKDNVLDLKPVMGGEDFGLYGRTPQKVPVCMFWLGAVAPQKMEASRKPGAPPLP
ncbi:MAG: amidohydrolase, partial [Acidobacteria bacterium]|nr:amidohydrolase [Acidobacteriota bacterium]